MKTHVIEAILVFEALVMSYFLLLNAIYLLFSVVAFFRLRTHRRRSGPEGLDAIVRSSATPGISIIAPAHNEEATVVESVRSRMNTSILPLVSPEMSVFAALENAT